MGITPLDIQEKEFERAFRGYDIEDVDEFLDQIARDLEELIRENKELKERVAALEDKNTNYRQMENTMQNAIVVAQKAADDVKVKAAREAESIRQDAELEGRRIIEEARGRSGKLVEEHKAILRQAGDFKVRFRTFLEDQLTMLDREKWPTLPEEKNREELAGNAGNVVEMTRTFDPDPSLKPEADPAPEEKPAEEEKVQDKPLFDDEDLSFDQDLDLDYGLERDLDKDPEF